MLSGFLKRIAEEYPTAKSETFAEHPLAKFVREDVQRTLQTSLVQYDRTLTSKGSVGNGNFADVPWLAIFDPLVTTGATRGYYAVFLFSTSGDLYLSLNQGTTAVRAEFGKLTKEILEDRAALMRARLSDFSERLPVTKINLGTDGRLPRDYEAGHALGVAYSASDWPSENRIAVDLGTIVEAYRVLTFRGGLDPSPEIDLGGDEWARPMTLPEFRTYRMHRRIERNGKLTALAKSIHGYTCQGCGFNFAEVYGDLGENYIEAHHLKPMASLQENVATPLSPETDFAALCSNCHRMIHKMDDSSDLSSFRRLIKRK